MDVRLLDNPVTFLAEAAPLLLDDEARHNLILGITETVRAAPEVYPERRFWVVRDGAGVVGAALRTPPHFLVLARPRADDALHALAAAIDEDLPGATGALPEIEAFGDAWAKRHGVKPRIVHAMGLYALEQVRAVPRPGGASREATEADRSLLLDWMLAFAVEALHGSETDDELERMLDYRLTAGAAGFVIWEDGGEPVSFSGYGGQTLNGIRIGPVYTPPDLRGRGYATALVADLSAQLLARGRRFCFLYTDLDNPTSNAIYERIGYVRTCEAAQVAFDPL